MKSLSKALKAAFMFTAVFAIAVMLGAGTQTQAASGDKVTTPEGLILKESAGQIVLREYAVVGYTDKLGTAVTIPQYYNDIPVTEIASEAFMNNTKIKSVKIPVSVHYLRGRAFKGCTSLESVEFEGDSQAWRKETWPKLSDVRPISLGSSVFEDCSSLKKLELNYGWEASGASNLVKNSGIKYLKLVIADKFGQGDGPGISGDCFIGNCPELEKIDIVVEKKTTNVNIIDIGDMPKLKEINIYEKTGRTRSMCNTIISDQNGGQYKTYGISRCPKLEYVNVYAGEEAIGAQFMSFTNFKPETAFEGTNVSRLNGKGNTFVIEGAGTAVFSVAEASFKVRLIVGGEASSQKNIADCKLIIPVKELICTGTARVPYLYLLDGKTVLEEDKDYTVSVKNNTEIGAATVTIEGIGDYTGTVSEAFSIVPVRTDVRSVKIGKKESTIVLNDNKQADGYQIYYSSKKNKGFKKLYSGTDTKAKVTGLKSGMYIKVRTYKKVGKTTYYSEWSAPVQVK